MLEEKPPPRLLRWRTLTVTLLVFGYAGYYLCRSNFSVTLPLIIDELATRGWDANSAKVRLGALASLGVGWRGVFFAAAGVMLIIFIVNFLLLKESPREIGEAEPRANPLNLVDEHEGSAKAALKWALTAFLRSPAFWIVCSLSLGTTLLRETFNTWTPTYFTEVVGLSKADAASKSALFPLFGGVSVLLAGFISDKLGRNGRALIILIGLLLSSAGLWLLGHARFGGSPALPVLLVAAVAFTLIGPYSYLAGAISLDFGGKRGSATASGIIDGVGYLGGVLAGDTVARVSVSFGWQGAFTALAGVALLSSLAAALFLIGQRRSVKTKIEMEAT